MQASCSSDIYGLFSPYFCLSFNVLKFIGFYDVLERWDKVQVDPKLGFYPWMHGLVQICVKLEVCVYVPRK